MDTSTRTRLLAGISLGCLLSFDAAAAGTVATFDDVASPPALDSATGIRFANGGSTLYKGIVWDERLRVVGDAYRVQTSPPGPLFGLPSSGHFFATNDNGTVGGQFTNDGIMLQTTLVLQSVRFGRNEYYGFGAGADQVTIHALDAGGEELASLTFQLPENNPGQPEPLALFRTTSFAALTGIAGYRIDRRELGQQSGSWVADDFVFSPVPEPGQYALLGLGLPMVLWLALRRTRRHAPA
jgi:hypothetical protein